MKGSRAGHGGDRSALALVAQQVNAAIALDRTRVIYSGNQKSMSVTVTNQNKSLPYLAQSWIEDSNGNKTETPFMAYGEKAHMRVLTERFMAYSLMLIFNLT
ncbi:fimbria/pilus periplasmic chaperone [Enterobacter asburiae]|nr:fimbria/pilus periplasmic chaperone [Enterobacter asburiae]